MPRPSTGPQLRANPKRQGTYYIFWTEDGRSREHSTGTTDQTRAAEYFAQWLARPKASTTGEWTGPRRAAETAIIDVLTLYAREYIAKDDTVVDKERPGYAIAALSAWWADRCCDAVLPQTCNAYIRDRKAQPQTAGRELSVLRAALGYAYKNGKLIEDLRQKVEVPPNPPPRDRWLDRSEAARLLWESRRDRQSRGHLPLFIQLMLRTGARPTSLFELRWTQIDFTHNRIDFNPPGRQRTSKGRPIIPIPKRLRWFLLAAHARAASPYVLSHDGGQLGSVKKSFRAARKRAGLGDDVIPYTLRHTAGTWLAQAGVDLWLIAGWLGHTQQKTTELYAHHSPTHMEAARRVMDR